MKKLSGIIFISIALLLASTVISAKVTRTERKTFDAKNGGELVIDAERASIKVETHSSSSIDLEITFKVKGSEDLADELINKYEIEYDSNGKDLKIKTNYHNNTSWFGNSKYNKLQIKFELKVPEEYNVDLKTSGGSISVGDLIGAAKARTSGGSLDFGKISGSILGRTSGGSIEISECSGDADVETSGGSIKISKCNGDVEAETSGGGITVDEVYGLVNASTSGGSIFASIREQPQSNCTLETSGGGITVELASDVNAYLDAQTSGGSVSTDFPITFKGKTERSKLKGEINDGGPILKLRTSGGSIRVVEK